MIRSTKISTLCAVIAASVLLAACQGLPLTTQQPTAIPTVIGDTGVTVQGNLVPAEFVNLSLNMAGMVAQVFVKEGDIVKAGQVLARLDQHERLAAAVANAELEAISARQALKSLNENADVATAAAQQSVAAAKDAVRSAERYLNNLLDGSLGTDIDSARANVVILKDRLNTAQKDFNSYENKPEDNLTRAEMLSKLADAQRRYDNAVRLLNNLEGSASEIDLEVARANLSLAQARQAKAEQDYEDVKSGPNPDDLEVAQARVKAAETGLAAAQQALTDSELVTPISGTLVKLDLKTGEQALPGKLVAVVADLSRWKVETDDLNENELPRIKLQDTVKVAPEALPELELSGTVESISQVSVEKYGDVTYTAKIDIEQNDPQLRWGMTVKVYFK
jgi:multidrug resistance efflux pump